jgi:hypothetical protein
MSGIYYLAMLIGVMWLAVWSILPLELRRRAWWPFEMRADALEDVEDSRPGTGHARARSTTAPPGADRAADRHPALPQPGAARSWRDRREQVPPSRRDR